MSTSAPAPPPPPDAPQSSSTSYSYSSSLNPSRPTRTKGSADTPLRPGGSASTHRHSQKFADIRDHSRPKPTRSAVLPAPPYWERRCPHRLRPSATPHISAPPPASFSPSSSYSSSIHPLIFHLAQRVLRSSKSEGRTAPRLPVPGREAGPPASAERPLIFHLAQRVLRSLGEGGSHRKRAPAPPYWERRCPHRLRPLRHTHTSAAPINRSIPAPPQVLPALLQQSQTTANHRKRAPAPPHWERRCPHRLRPLRHTHPSASQHPATPQHHHP